jgi:hypothetical protein
LRSTPSLARRKIKSSAEGKQTASGERKRERLGERRRRRSIAIADNGNAEVLGLRLLSLYDDKLNVPSCAAMQSLIDEGADVNTQ